MSLMDRQILGVCLNNETYSKVANLVKKDFFARELSTVIDTLHFCHDKYKADLTIEDLLATHLSLIHI